MIASTTSPSSLPAGATATSSRSSDTAHLLAHARRLSARALAARSHPRTVPGRTLQPASDPTMPLAPGSQRERLADHLRAVAPTRHRPRRTQHVRRAAPLTARPPRPDRPHAIQQPQLARARVTPPRQSPTAARARDHAGGQFDLLADRDRQQRQSSVHACRPKAFQTAPRPERGDSRGNNYQTADYSASPRSRRRSAPSRA